VPSSRKVVVIGGVVRDPVFFQKVKNVRVMNETEAVKLGRMSKRVLIRAVQSGEESWLPYDSLVLATGASPVMPPIPGVNLANVFTFHGMRDAENNRRLLDEDKARDVVSKTARGSFGKHNDTGRAEDRPRHLRITRKDDATWSSQSLPNALVVALSFRTVLRERFVGTWRTPCSTPRPAASC